MASPVLGSVRRSTGRRSSTTPRAEASLTPAVASFRPFSVGRCPPHSCFEGRSATPATCRVLSSVSCVRRGELPDLVWPGGRGSKSRRELFDRLPPLSLAVSTQRQSAATMVCSAVDGQDSPVRRTAARALPWPSGGCLSLRPCLGVGRAGFTGCPGLSRAVCRGLGLAGGARSVSGTSSSLQNLRDRHSLAGPDCLGAFERAWQSLRFSGTATRPPSRCRSGSGCEDAWCAPARSSISASHSAPQGHGSGFSRSPGAVLPASVTPALHRLIGWSQTFSLRAASATAAWPDGAPNTIRATPSAGRTLAGKLTSARV